MIKFSSPQINLYVDDLEVSKHFYTKLGFTVTFQAIIDGVVTHYEMQLDGFKLGVATKKSAQEVHGLKPGKNSGSELVLWVEDTDKAYEYLISLGERPTSEPHNFLGSLRSGWVEDPDGNPIEIVSKMNQA